MHRRRNIEKYRPNPYQIFDHYKICVALLLRLSVLFSAVSQDHSSSLTRNTVSHQLTLVNVTAAQTIGVGPFTAHINLSQKNTAATPLQPFLY